MNFIQRFMAFMQGRYGMDTLNGFLLGVELALWITQMFFNLFMRISLSKMIVMAVFWLVEMGILALVVFRFLSRNINMRSKENRVFRKAFDPVKDWVKFQIKKFKERKDYKYLKCPMCKAQLRVRNVKGEHGVRCPKCGGTFKTTI